MLEFLLENNFVKPLFYLRKDKIDTTTEISTVISVFTYTFCPIALFPIMHIKRARNFLALLGCRCISLHATLTVSLTVIVLGEH
jgi:hypothetical protein